MTLSICARALPRRIRLLPSFVFLALVAAFILAPKVADSGIIGGDDVIRVDPDFSPAVQLRSNVLGSVVGIQFGDTVLGSPGDLSQTLGAALSQQISAANRPSVLTPYQGLLPTSEGEDELLYDSFGSIATNKAATIGKGRLAIGLSYQRSRFTEFDGHPIGKAAGGSKTFFIPLTKVENDIGLANILGFNDVSFRGTQEFELEVSNVKFGVDVITLAVTYGLLDRLDVGALIPYIFLETNGTASLKVRTKGELFGSDPGPVTPLIPPDKIDQTDKFKGDWDEDFDGFGDIVLFAKFQILSQAGVIGSEHKPAPVDLAVQTELKLPTGDEGEFLGTAKTDIAIRLVAQREFAVGEQLFRVRGEVGFNRSGLGNDFNTFEYKSGIEWEVLPGQLAVSAEILGSDSREFDQILDAVLGAKYLFAENPYLDAVFGGLRFPINNNGLQADYSPIIGIEKTFDSPFSRSEELASLGPRDLPEFEPIADPIAARPVQSAPALEPPTPAPPAPTTPTPILSEQTRPALPEAQRTAPPATTKPVAAEIPEDYRIPVRGPSLPRDPSDPLPLPRGRNYSGPPSDR